MYKGIDVSKWQGEIDFNKVKAAGYEFVIIRAGWGKTATDPYYEINYNKAKAAGLKVGGYLYSYAGGTEDAKKEANHVRELIKGKAFDLPFAYDVEDPKILKKTVPEIRKIIDTFMAENRDLNVSIYTSKSYAENWGLDKTAYPIWIAQWGPSCTYKGKYYMWQQTSKGSVPGISGRVDIDEYYGEFSTDKPKPTKTVEELAIEVIAGLWGNGEERKRRLTEAGYDYAAVQKRVNEILKGDSVVTGRKQGDAVNLNNCKLYASSVSKKPVKYVSGTYYIYDGISFKGRYRITNRKGNCGKSPAALFVTGYIDL